MPPRVLSLPPVTLRFLSSALFAPLFACRLHYVTFLLLYVPRSFFIIPLCRKVSLNVTALFFTVWYNAIAYSCGTKFFLSFFIKDRDISPFSSLYSVGIKITAKIVKGYWKRQKKRKKINVLYVSNGQSCNVLRRPTKIE